MQNVWLENWKKKTNEKKWVKWFSIRSWWEFTLCAVHSPNQTSLCLDCAVFLWPTYKIYGVHIEIEFEMSSLCNVRSLYSVNTTHYTQCAVSLCATHFDIFRRPFSTQFGCVRCRIENFNTIERIYVADMCHNHNPTQWPIINISTADIVLVWFTYCIV